MAAAASVTRRAQPPTATKSPKPSVSSDVPAKYSDEPRFSGGGRICVAHGVQQQAVADDQAGDPADQQQHDRQRAEAAQERLAAVGGCKRRPSHRHGHPQPGGHVAAETKAATVRRRAPRHDDGEEDVEQDRGQHSQPDDTLDQASDVHGREHSASDVRMRDL